MYAGGVFLNNFQINFFYLALIKGELFITRLNFYNVFCLINHTISSYSSPNIISGKIWHQQSLILDTIFILSKYHLRILIFLMYK